jgi:murein DD-endopeptidase MepM/ murein hydrolase activator NlpD
MLYTMFLIITLTLLTQVNNGFNSLFKENLTEYALNPKTYVLGMGANSRQPSATGANMAAANAGSTIGGGDDAGKCKDLKRVGDIVQLCAPSTANTGLFPAPGTMTSGYGWRWGRMHEGWDVANPTGTEIVAAGPGVVIYSEWNSGGYGYLVEISHPCARGSNQCYITRYAHNSELRVKQWQKVEQGQVIALMGSTGKSSGPHLHFEVRHNNKAINASQQPPIMIDTSQTYHAGAGVTDKIGKTIEAGVNTAGRAVSNAIGGTMKSLGLAFTGVEMTKERLMDAVMYFFMSIAIVQIAIELGKIVKTLATASVEHLNKGWGGGGGKLENINKTKAATKETGKAVKTAKPAT